MALAYQLQAAPHALTSVQTCLSVPEVSPVLASVRCESLWTHERAQWRSGQAQSQTPMPVLYMHSLDGTHALYLGRALMTAMHDVAACRKPVTTGVISR